MTIQPGLSRYDDGEYPPLVCRAVEAARAAGFDKACTPEVGALLRVLAAGAERIGETGTACGVGAAWMASGMPAGATLVTAENDPAAAATAGDVFAEDTRVRVLVGDANALMPEHAPYDLLFTDGGLDKSDPEPILALMAVGGVVVLDDLTPEHAWTDALRAKYPDGDPVRRSWRRGDLVSSELMVTPTESVLIAVRR